MQNGYVQSGQTGSLLMDVIEERGKIVGYGVWEIDIRKLKSHILNLAIRPDERRKGKGKMLLNHIITHLKTNKIHYCQLEVRDSNRQARALYESYGFVASDRIPGYYFDEDAIVYTIEL
jgi:ribosomal-protein-alanine N-acetyltransferase